MNIVASEVGIDVASEELVTSIDEGKPFRTRNTEEGAEQIARRLPAGCTVHLESSGGYERTVLRVLRNAGFDVRCHNPLRARRVAQGTGAGAKTDPIDAVMLSEKGRLMPVHEVKAAERRDLADFSRAIDTIKETIAGYKKRRNMPELDKGAKDAYSAVIKVLQAQAKQLERTFVERVKSSAYKEQYKLAISVRCVGPVAARVCVCELPENFKLQPTNHSTSYAGIAPIDKSSGKRKKAHIAHGNSRLKRGLYMCGVTALRDEPWARKLYARLIAQGRTHDQAIVPIMRRILVRVVCVTKRGSPWQDEPPKG
jgi:transposase